MKKIESTFWATPEKGEVSALWLEPEHAKAALVLGHGAGAGMLHPNMDNIAHHFAAVGIASLRYQFPYMERGGGRDSEKVSLATVRAAVGHAKRYAGNLPIFAGGHSFGGRMTYLTAAEELPEVQGLIFCSFPLHAPGKPGVERAAKLMQVSVPMLFLSGDRDTFAKRELMDPLIDSLGEKATIHWIHTMNHGYKILKRTRTSEESVFEEMARLAQAWIDQQTPGK
ncbi:MAG: alpha/beta family hydrolase [Bacteroidota bacterium]